MSIKINTSSLQDLLERANALPEAVNIDSELNTQDILIAQIISQLENKASYNTIYISSSEPTDDVGVNGDIYIVRSEST